MTMPASFVPDADGKVSDAQVAVWILEQEFERRLELAVVCAKADAAFEHHISAPPTLWARLARWASNLFA